MKCRVSVSVLKGHVLFSTLALTLGMVGDVHSVPIIGPLSLARADDDDKLIIYAKSLGFKVDREAILITNKFQVGLSAFGEGISVKVLPLPMRKYAVLLTGTADNLDAVKEKAENLKNETLNVQVLNFTGLALPKPKSPVDEQQRQINQVQELFGLMLGNPDVKIKVQLSPDKKSFIIILTGSASTANNAAIKANIEKGVYVDTVKDVLGLDVSKIILSFLSTVDSSVSVWPLTFVHSSVPNPTPSGLDRTLLAASSPTTAEKIAMALSTYMGDGVKIQAFANSLLIKGEESKVRRVKTLLARDIDIPFPQVSLDVWTIQINSKSTRDQSKEKAQEKMSDIKAGIQMTRDLESELLNTIMMFVRKEGMLNFPNNKASHKPVDHLKELMETANFDTDPHHPLSVVDILAFLALCDRDKLEGSGPNTLSAELLETINKFTKNVHSDKGHLERRSQKLQGLIKRIQDTVKFQGNEQVSSVMPHLIRTYTASDQNATLTGIANFFYFYLQTNEPVKPIPGLNLFPKEDLASALAHSSAETDDLLKYGADALHTDLKAICMKPLIDWIREDMRDGSNGSSGIDLVGNTSIVVTSNQPAQTLASAETYFPFTPRPRLTEQMLTDAKTLSDGTSGGGKKIGTQTDTTKSSGSNSIGPDTNKVTTGQSAETGTTQDLFSKSISLATTALGTISPLEALAVKAIFAADPDTVYNRVAPGISLGIRPTVFRDGGTARLQINLSTEMETDHTNNPRQNGTPYDLIRGHSLETDVAVRALDIFELSTFGMETTGPGEPTYRIPLLEMLPVIGKYFVGPARRETKHQESLLIVNVTILPRSLDLADRNNSK